MAAVMGAIDASAVLAEEREAEAATEAIAKLGIPSPSLDHMHFRDYDHVCKSWEV